MRGEKTGKRERERGKLVGKGLSERETEQRNEDWFQYDLVVQLQHSPYPI